MNDTFPNAVGATALFNAPVTVRVGNPTTNYTIALPTDQDITLGQMTIDNTNFSNFYNVNFNQGKELVWQMNAGDPTVLAKYIETAGTAPGVTTRYSVNPVIRVLSDWEITQQNVVNLNTGTIFGGVINGGADRKIIKEGNGGIQFNASVSLLPGEGFLGEYIIDRGAVRMLGTSAIAAAKAVTVNAGGQLQLADNATTVNNPDWSLGAGASLFLNGTGKDVSVPTITNAEGALRIGIQSGRTTTFHNPVVLQSDSVIYVSIGATGSLEQAVSGIGGLVKDGQGTLTLSSPSNSYSGDTKFAGMNRGTLSLPSAVLADGRDVYLTTGSTLNLDFSATDTIRSLYIDGVAQPIGTWGDASLTPDHATNLITGGGLLQVTTLPSMGVLGDYNGNGTVDAADYVLWRKGGPLQNEVSDPGVVNAQDYEDWKARFGNTSGGSGGSTLDATTAVPEPGSALLAVLAIGGIVALGIRRS